MERVKITNNKQLSKKEKRKEIQRNMDDIIQLMQEGYSQDEAAIKINLDPVIVKQWYDKGWHNEGGELYINFFKKARELKYSNTSSKGFVNNLVF